uniref:C2 domain-containing protein n=1 Tax=Setaria digitata TaxID=48799 RepID=A0A915PPI9_9BILA
MKFTAIKAYSILPLEDFPETIEEDDDDNNIVPLDDKIMPTVPIGETTCRIKLLRPELPSEMQLENAADLHCAINVKERIEINGEKRLIQKRKTSHPEWNKCWDIGVVPGRVLQVLLLNGTTPIADATMRQMDIISKCKGENATHVWINLKPAGRILAQVCHISNPGKFSNLLTIHK